MKNLIGKFIKDRQTCESICFIMQGYLVLLAFALVASLEPIMERLGLA
jgi:hypothetical protein